MARQHRIWRSFLGYSATIVALAVACGSNDEHPPVASPGSGGSNSSGGKAGTSGSGGLADSGADGDASLGGSAGLDGSAGTAGQAGTAGMAGAGAGDGGVVDAAHCSDKSHNADESDVDCGGKDCPGCATGENCSGNSDCVSKKCNAQLLTCSAPVCTDQVQNGNETDVDCGGANCSPCADGKMCDQATDCKSGVCTGSTQKTCQVPSCTDGVNNGTETDTDCGGNCTQKCGLGQACKAAGDCDTANCGSNQCKCPQNMVIAPAAGGGAYCIDEHEVTYKEYALFWNANPIAQINECSWNKSYTPPKNWPVPPGKTNEYPITNLDWCDAYAYCTWAGKRLCGKIGGGSAPYSAFADHTQDQWYNGCSAGANTYPYGSTWDAALCVNASSGTQTKTTACQGASPGLFDMSGNVAEWEDSCAGSGQSDGCRIRGGSYSGGQTELECVADRSGARDATFDDVGFRCCYQ